MEERTLKILSPRILAPILAVTALTVIIFVPRDTSELAIETFRLERVPATRMAMPWHSGHSFVVQLELTLPGYPVLFHVDSQGSPSLMYPESVETPLSVVAGSISTHLPRENNSWKLSGGPGTQTFLLAVSSKAEVNLRDLASKVSKEAEASGSPEAAVAAARQFLEDEVGPVRIQTLQIQP